MDYKIKTKRLISESIHGIFVLSLIFLCLFCGCGKDILVVADDNTIIEEDPLDDAVEAVEAEVDNRKIEQTKETVTVHICGAVKQSGVYELMEGSRIIDGINAAGGFSEDACESAINLSEILADAKRIYIPTLEEVEKGEFKEEYAGYDGGNTENGVININTAGIDELQTLTGIGATRAEAIIAYREQNGGFKNIEEIKNVSGIGESSYQKIKEKITAK